MEDDRAQRVNDKPNAADFADQRELALVKATQRNRKNNKTLRLSPPVLSARASEIDTTTSDEDPQVEVLPPETKDTPDEDELDGSVQSDDEEDDDEESNYMVPITISILILAIIMAVVFKMKMKQ